MQCFCRYSSPLGELLLTADELGLTGLAFAEAERTAAPAETGEDPERFREAVAWLDAYFSGKDPGFTPRLHLIGTAFRRRVWTLLLTIPYGATVSYGALAARLSAEPGVGKTSARAVGGAVGKNPVALIVPCHRVVGADGSLTGYAGGLDRKKALLLSEQGKTPPTRVPE